MDKLLTETLGEMGIGITPAQTEQFMVYLALLEEWNQKMNLTAIREPRDVVLKHFADSISLLKVLPEKKGFSFIDIGTGAGFPGIPVKIMRADCSVLLVDATSKKLTFVETVIDRLGLQDARCLPGRIEAFGQEKAYREKFDVAASRAVAPLNILLEYGLPLVKPGGLFIAMKGANYREEWQEAEKAVALLGGKPLQCVEVAIPNTDILHSLLIVRKLKQTPPQYPRNNSQIRKKPMN